MKKGIFSVLTAMLLVIMLVAFQAGAATAEEGQAIATAANAMTFPTDGTDYTADCPVCGKSATWTALTPETISAGFTAASANTHYYLTDSVEAAGAKFTMANSSKYTCCLHLNGKNLVSTSSRAIEGAAGKLNIMGTGTVKGAGTDSYGNAATVLMGNVGSINLYGGTYEKYDPAAATNTVGIGWGGGTIAVHTGATVKAGTSGSAVYLDSTLGVANATLNVYGGTVDGSASTDAPAVNIEAVDDSNTRKLTLNLYDGVIKGGTRSYGGCIPIQKNTTVNIHGGSVQDGTGDYGGNIYIANGGVLNMYGGTVSGGTVSRKGGNIYAGTSGVFNMYDGTITGGVCNGTTLNNGVDDGGGNVFLYTSSVMTMHKGTISGGKAKVSGGNVCIGQSATFNLYGGEITGGTANTGSTNYLTGGGNVYVGRSAEFNMSGGTISSGTANKGGNIGSTRAATLNLTGGIVEKGTAKAEGGNIFSNSYSTTAANRVNINLSNVIIREGTCTAGPGGNLGLSAGNLNIGEGAQILDGKAQGSGGRGGNIRIYIGTLVMTGGKLSGGTAASSDGTDEVWVQGKDSSLLSNMYMLGGVIEGKETRNSSLRVDSNGRLYLGGNAIVMDSNTGNAEIYGNGPVYICDGWSGSATIRFSTPGTTGECMSTSALQVVTLDADRTATVGGSYSGKLLDFTNQTQLIGMGDANGTVVIGGTAVVDAEGNVTMTTDPLTEWATGGYAYIRLFSDYELADPAADLWIDLNGSDLTLSGSGAINVFDTANDSYNADACGKIINNGTVTVDGNVMAPNGKRYIALTDNDGAITMHRLDLRITSVSLRPSAAGLYYKAKYECDTALSAKVARYGVVLSVQNMPGEDFLTEKDRNLYTEADQPFSSGVEATSGAVFGIMKDANTAEVNAANGEVDIYANPYICFDMGSDMIVMADNENPGKTVESEGFDGIAYGLHDILDMLDASFYDHQPATRNAISNFYLAWKEKGMADWEFDSIGQLVDFVGNSDLEFAQGSTDALCPACEKTVTWTPFSQSDDTTVNIGTAAGGAHYYLTEDITYTGSGAGFIANPTVKNQTACLHLNGHNLTASAHAVIYTPYAHAGTLNVMGEGTVSGNRSATGVTIYLSSKDAAGRINLYGGTYVKPASNTAALTTVINGGSIHVYEGAWIKGNGSGFAAYMDAGSNADATFAFHGGKITGGEMGATDTGAADKHTRTFIIDSNSYVEELNVRDVDVVVEISGVPVIDRIGMVSGAKLTVGDLAPGASISVSTNKVFTHSFEKAEAYLKYFHAWNEPDSITVTDAGELYYSINYEYYMTPYVRDVKAQAIADGQIHYYFMAAKGMIMSPTNAGDMDKWGDSCLVVFPNGETMLIDSGYAIQAPVIIGSLKRMGVTTLDYLVITHPHNDHIGGAFSSSSTFLEEIAVEQVYYQDLNYGSGWDGVVASKCSARNIPYTALWTGDVLTIGEGELAVTMTMLWPGEDADLTIASAENNNSMVFRFDYGEHSSLFTADIYTATETKLRELYTNGELDVDMLKVPHHGLQLSSSSLAFLQAVTPEIAVATGSFDINDTINTRYTSTDASKGVGATLLEDRFHGYIHISSGTDGVMTTETES